MISDLISSPIQNPNVAVLIFSIVFSAGLGWLSYRLLQSVDENTAFWASIVVFLLAAVVGLFTHAYLPLLGLALAAIGYFAPRVPRRSWSAAGIVLLAVGVSYVGLPVRDNRKNPITKSAVANHFAYDDKDLLTNNDFMVGWLSGAPDLQKRPQNYWKDVLTKDFAQLAVKAAGAPGLNPINYYRPVIALSYMLDTFFWGKAPPWEEFSKSSARAELKWEKLNPVGFHLTNVLVHAINSLLVFLLVRSLTRRRWVALAAGVLFAVHPVHTESVTWIAGRTDVMAATFYLAAFWLYVRFRNTRSPGTIVIAVLLALAAALTKEMTLPLGVVLLAYELIRFVARRDGTGDLYLPARPVWMWDSPRESRLLAGASLSLVGFSILGALIYFQVKSHVVAGSELPPIVQASPWYDPETGTIFSLGKIFFAFMSAGFWYLQKAVFPLPLNIYPNVAWVAAPTGMLLLLAHAAIVTLAVVLLFVWKHGRLLTLGVIGFYLSLGPLSCLIKGARLLRFSEDVDFPVSERFLYIPSIFICLALAWLIAYELPRWFPAARGMVVGAVLAVLAGMGAYADHRRALDWYDDYHLFQSGVRTNPTSVRMSNNFGFELMQNWEIKRARQQLLRCTSLVSDFHEKRTPMPVAFQNLGHSYYLQGEFSKAVEYYRKSFQYDPKNAVSANNLGALMGIFGSITMNINLVQEGYEYYRRAVELAPNYVYAKQSEDFMRRVFITWSRYLKAGDRTPEVVWSFGNSFLFAAKSISESDEPKYLQAMQILDSGLRFMPGDEELEKIFEKPLNIPFPPGGKEGESKPDPRAIKQDMAKRFDLCLERGIEKYERLLAKRAKEEPAAGARNPALNFLLGEVFRVGWRRTHSAEHSEKAKEHYEITLAQEPEHGGATRGMTELLRADGAHERAQTLAAATVDALLTPERPWEENIPDPTPRPRTREALELAREIVALAGVERRVQPEKVSEAQGKRWEGFQMETAQKCLDAQRRLAETYLGGQDAESWNNLGYFYVLTFEISRDAKMLQAALEHLEHALELDPVRPGPILNKIHVLRLMGRTREAESLRESMRQRFPRDPRFMPPPEAPANATVVPGPVSPPPGAPRPGR